MNSPAQHEGRGRMSQIVEPHVWQLRTIQPRREGAAQEIARFDRPADRRDLAVFGAEIVSTPGPP